MPCYSIVTYGATLEKVKDLTRLAKGMEKDGWKIHSQNEAYLSATSPEGQGVTITRAGDRTTLSASGTRGASVQKAVSRFETELTKTYVRETVAAGAKRFGWQVKQTEKDQLVLRR
jgi:gamma-glutamylcysteine synthetase